MEEKARQNFLLKLYNQGFLIDDQGETLILTPRGYAEPAVMTITEVEPNLWRVTDGRGAYTRYYQSKKHRDWFETLLAGLVNLSQY